MASLYNHSGWSKYRDGYFTKACKFIGLTNKDSDTSYTTLMSSAFLDQWLKGVYGTFDPKERKVKLLDGGDRAFTGCSLPFLAACIVATLNMDEDKTKNKRIPVAEVRMTMSEVVETFEKVLGVGFETVNNTSEDVLKIRDDALMSGDFVTATLLTHVVGAFNVQGAGDLSAGLTFDFGKEEKDARRAL